MVPGAVVTASLDIPAYVAKPAAPAVKKGGRLFVRATAQLGILDHIDFVAKGGSPGVGGPGGPGGPGGQGGVGGPGGDTDGWCHGQGPRGSDGPPGPNGSPGQTGQAGAEGLLPARL
jgi:hypothetical protein